MKRTIRYAVDEVDFKLKGQQVLRDWLTRVADAHERKIQELDYVFVSDEKLLQMNQEFLQHDTLTDIITFPYDVEHADGVIGEIYISVDRVRENAAEFGNTFDVELRRVMAHGLLHLFGFKDKSKADIKRMRDAEDAALALFV
jgi:probable rRNA maturation factor